MTFALVCSPKFALVTAMKLLRESFKLNEVIIGRLPNTEPKSPSPL